MRIRATCHFCSRDFLFFELRNTGGSRLADQCPNCGSVLGVRGLTAVRTEQALAVLLESLDELTRHEPNFTVHRDSVLRPVDAALEPLTALPAKGPPKRKRRSKRLNPVA
jgi:hypothetical protein